MCKPVKQMFYESCFDDKEMIEKIIKYSNEHFDEYSNDEEIQLSKFNLNIFSPLKEELTCLDFAVSAEIKKFTSHPASQKCFKLFWAGELLPIEKQTFNTWPKVLFYLLSLKNFNASYLFIFQIFLISIVLLPFPIIAPFVMKYKEKDESNKVNNLKLF